MTKSADAAPAARFAEFATARRAEIDAALERWLSSPSTPPVLAGAMRYSVTAGGKRLRPLLTLAAADAVDGARGRALALPAACALEMLHTYSLIHDDLPAMDDDTLRRGRPTLHVVAGEGMAILAGDALQAEAFALLAREPAADADGISERKVRTIAVIAAAAGAAGMVGGQAIDLDAARPGPGRERTPLSPAEVETMHRLKTGAMIQAAAVAGAVMAGADHHLLTAIGGYAADVGLAFQIVDDILDVEAASSTLGKTAGKDAAAGKPTYPALFGLERSRQLAADCVTRAERQLASVALDRSHLLGIARSIVTRTS